jgi:hypothetical protein
MGLRQVAVLGVEHGTFNLIYFIIVIFLLMYVSYRYSLYYDKPAHELVVPSSGLQVLNPITINMTSLALYKTFNLYLLYGKSGTIKVISI